MKIREIGQRMPGISIRLFICYVLVPCLLSLLCIVRGTVYAPSLPYWDRVWLFMPPAIPGWIVAGVLIAGLIELTNARSLVATVASTAVGAVLAAAFNYYELSIYYYFMRDRWPWLRPLYDGNVPLFNASLLKFLVGPSSIYFYAAIAITYAGYRALVPGARYLGDIGRRTAGAIPELNPAREESQAAANDRALTPTNNIGAGTPAFIRRLDPHLGSDLVLVTYRIKMSSGEDVPVSRSQTGVVSRRLSQHNATVLGRHNGCKPSRSGLGVV